MKPLIENKFRETVAAFLYCHYIILALSSLFLSNSNLLVPVRINRIRDLIEIPTVRVANTQLLANALSVLHLALDADECLAARLNSQPKECSDEVLHVDGREEDGGRGG